MASARVHASSRHRSMVYCVTGDSNPGRVDFKHHSGYSKYKVQTLETLTKFTEQETARVSYQRSAKYYGRSSSRSISGNSNSDRELGEISSGSLCENPLEFNGEGQKSQDLNNKRKYSCFPEDSVDKQFPKLLDDEFEPGQIRESPEFRREEEPFLNIGSSRWGNDDDDDNDSNSPNPKRRKLSSNSSVLLSPNLDNSERRKIASNISGGETLTAESPKCRPEEKPLPNIAASRWADDEDLEISDLKRTNLSSNPDDCDSQEHKKLRLSSVLGVKNSSCSSGGETLSPYDARESARTRSDGSGVSSVCSDIDGGRGSIESSRGAEIGVSDDEHVQMDLDSDEEQVGLDSDQGLPSESDCPTLSPSQLPVLAGRQIDMMQGCKIVDEFERLNKINEGTYGIVYRARNKKTGEIVALKKVKMEREREGFPMSALREINVLLSLQHPSVVNVKEVVVGNNLDNIFMVMEYMEHDLKDFMGMMKQPFSTSEVKCLILQLLEGVNYLHDNWILHRDLKTSNLLINNKGELKICDFGLARQYGSPLKTYTQLVVTLWYRAPELLLGAKKYSTAVDMWSVGCIMAELLSKEPLFSGKSDIDQLDKIFRTMGTPNQKIWPDFANLPGAKCSFVKQPYNKLREKFPAASFSGKQALSESGFDLLNRFLTYDPNKRITAEEALNHQWFREVPLPKSKEFMPTYPSRSDHDRQSRRVMKSPDPLERLRRVEPGELAIGGLFG